MHNHALYSFLCDIVLIFVLLRAYEQASSVCKVGMYTF